MEITPIPQLTDNYAWLLVAEKKCAVVDPAAARSVTALIRDRGLELTSILATHHHADHTAGIAELKAAHDCEVVASAVEQESGRVPGQSRGMADGEQLELLGELATCLLVPGHTRGAVAFYFAASRAAFTGDTLFLAGCGRLFEGSAAQMQASLAKIAALPDDTKIYCGHEYTQNNLRFAHSVLPDDAGIDARLAEVAAQRARGEASVPATLAVEKATNPFLRVHEPQVAQALGISDPQALFAELRKRRDRW